MVKQVPLVHRNKNNDKEDEDNFLERTRAEAIVPMLLREDENDRLDISRKRYSK